MTNTDTNNQIDISTLTTEEVYALFGGKDNRGATSRAIRHLIDLGWKRGRIAKVLNIRYQHVRNVEKEPLKRSAE
jgi:hypothetical protein